MVYLERESDAMTKALKSLPSVSAWGSKVDRSEQVWAAPQVGVIHDSPKTVSAFFSFVGFAC
jgi:hypothetical protein